MAKNGPSQSPEMKVDEEANLIPRNTHSGAQMQRFSVITA